MRRSNVAVCTLGLLVGLLFGSSVMLRPIRAQSPAIGRPGDAKYEPTKLEWAALELQANYAQTWASESPVAASFSPTGDGKSVLCLLQFTSDVSAVKVKTGRDVEQIIFERYAKSRGWSWLRLQFQEKVLPAPNVTIR